MSTTEENLFSEHILAPIGEATRTKLLPNREVSGFLAAKGRKYSGELMVVGRATNGWEGSCFPGGNPCKAPYPEKFTDPAFRKKFAREIQMSVSGDDPMAWVHQQWGAKNCYNTKRSAFWRVIRRVTVGLNIAGESYGDWASHLVWSNLYKVSPNAGGNPSDRLCYRQFQGCKDLFRLELDTYRPQRLLLLTGWNWADGFLCGLVKVDATGNYVERVGTLPSTDGYPISVVVARHPQGKSEEAWSTEVLETFGR